MAGDWIKMRTNLWDHPKVAKLASAICPQNVREKSDARPQNVQRMSNRAFVIGALFRTWSLADAYTADGILDGYDAEMLDELVGYNGWSENLQHIGWLIVEPQRLIVPGFTEHNGESSKRRAEDAARKKRVRKMSAECPKNVRENSDQRREEKRREENKETPLPPELNSPEFASAWDDWQRHRRELKKPLRPTMIAEQLSLMASWGIPRSVAAIRHTIAMGWQGLREPEAAKSTAAAPPGEFWMPKAARRETA
jgi:hypothetical protein